MCQWCSCALVVVQVRDWYLDSFQDLRSFPEIVTPSDELAFTKLLAAIKERHNHVVPTMAMGIQELKNDLGRRTGFMHDYPDIHQFLDRFFMSRIGIRMLIGQSHTLFPNWHGSHGTKRCWRSPGLIHQDEACHSSCRRPKGQI